MAYLFELVLEVKFLRHCNRTWNKRTSFSSIRNTSKNDFSNLEEWWTFFKIVLTTSISFSSKPLFITAGIIRFYRKKAFNNCLSDALNHNRLSFLMCPIARAHLNTRKIFEVCKKAHKVRREMSFLVKLHFIEHLQWPLLKQDKY